MIAIPVNVGWGVLANVGFDATYWFSSHVGMNVQMQAGIEYVCWPLYWVPLIRLPVGIIFALGR